MEPSTLTVSSTEPSNSKLNDVEKGNRHTNVFIASGDFLRSDLIVGAAPTIKSEMMPHHPVKMKGPTDNRSRTK